jgi:hypothetical protein
MIIMRMFKNYSWFIILIVILVITFYFVNIYHKREIKNIIESNRKFYLSEGYIQKQNKVCSHSLTQFSGPYEIISGPVEGVYDDDIKSLYNDSEIVVSAQQKGFVSNQIQKLQVLKIFKSNGNLKVGNEILVNSTPEFATESRYECVQMCKSEKKIFLPSRILNCEFKEIDHQGKPLDGLKVFVFLRQIASPNEYALVHRIRYVLYGIVNAYNDGSVEQQKSAYIKEEQYEKVLKELADKITSEKNP